MTTTFTQFFRKLRHWRVCHVANGKHENGQTYYTPPHFLFPALYRMVRIMIKNRSFQAWIEWSK